MEQGEDVEKPLVIGLRDRAILATLRFAACRAGAVRKPAVGDFSSMMDRNMCLQFSGEGGKSNPDTHTSPCFMFPKMLLPPQAYIEAKACIKGEAKDAPLFRARSNGTVKTLTHNPLTSKADLRAGQATARRCRVAVAAVAAQFPGVGDH